MQTGLLVTQILILFSTLYLFSSCSLLIFFLLVSFFAFISPFIYLSVNLFIYTSVSFSVCLFIHPFVHYSVQHTHRALRHPCTYLFACCAPGRSRPSSGVGTQQWLLRVTSHPLWCKNYGLSASSVRLKNKRKY